MDDAREHFLQPIDDGLALRESQEYARYKLKVLELYVKITNGAMSAKWPNRSFIDLQCGPGKNRIRNEILLGSPLLAYTAPNPAKHFYFNELDKVLLDALASRLGESSAIHYSNKDSNIAVNEISQQIKAHEPTSLNIAFLDPEGLEIRWDTVRKLAEIPRTDLIINFSTQGILRNHGAGNFDVIDDFFGTHEWLRVYETSRHTRRALIDFYLGRLANMGYKTDIDPELPPAEIVAKNSKNSEIYSVIFASRNDLGQKFWRQAEKYTNSQQRLL